MENNQLYHHGILGMKWGVRRFQNKDGSLTKAGKKRYGDDSDAAKPKKKSVSDMSDDELNKAIRRAQMEDQYRSLRPEKVSAGRKFFGTLGSKVVAPALIGAGENFLRKALTQYGDDILKKNPSEMDKLKKEYEKLDLQDKIKRLKNEEDSKLWESRTKKLEYESKKKDQRNDDLKRDFDYDKTKKAYDDWREKNKSSTKSDTGSDDGSVKTDWLGGGKSTKSESTSSNKNQRTIYTDDWKDITNRQASTMQTAKIAAGETFVTGLLSAPKTGQLAAPSAAGLLAPPKEVDS